MNVSPHGGTFGDRGAMPPVAAFDATWRCSMTFAAAPDQVVAVHEATGVLYRTATPTGPWYVLPADDVRSQVDRAVWEIARRHPNQRLAIQVEDETSTVVARLTVCAVIEPATN